MYRFVTEHSLRNKAVMLAYLARLNAGCLIFNLNFLDDLVARNFISNSDLDFEKELLELGYVFINVPNRMYIIFDLQMLTANSQVLNNLSGFTTTIDKTKYFIDSLYDSLSFFKDSVKTDTDKTK